MIIIVIYWVIWVQDHRGRGRILQTKCQGFFTITIIGFMIVINFCSILGDF